MATSTKKSIMTLYSKENDPYSQRVRIVLQEKGVTFDTNYVDTNPKYQDELLEINPYGTLPTLLDRDLVLYGSEIIMEYLDERFPHPPLMPVYPVARGRTRLMIYRVNNDWYTLMTKILSNKTSEEEKEKARVDLNNSITSVIPIFSEMPFFLSEEFSLVDCCIAPILWRLPELKITLPKQAQPILDYANRIFQRPSFQDSLSNKEKAIHTQVTA